jgi:hypothetical protein
MDYHFKNLCDILNKFNAAIEGYDATPIELIAFLHANGVFAPKYKHYQKCFCAFNNRSSINSLISENNSELCAMYIENIAVNDSCSEFFYYVAPERLADNIYDTNSTQDKMRVLYESEVFVDAQNIHRKRYEADAYKVPLAAKFSLLNRSALLKAVDSIKKPLKDSLKDVSNTAKLLLIHGILTSTYKLGDEVYVVRPSSTSVSSDAEIRRCSVTGIVFDTQISAPKYRLRPYVVTEEEIDGAFSSKWCELFSEWALSATLEDARMQQAISV